MRIDLPDPKFDLVIPELLGEVACDAMCLHSGKASVPPHKCPMNGTHTFIHASDGAASHLFLCWIHVRYVITHGFIEVDL